jgi:hypothetical protein
MRKTMAVVFGGVLVAFGLACSGMNLPIPGAGGSFANVEACKKYVKAFNDATCSGTDLSEGDICPASLDMTPCDLASYYTCMADNVKCNGDFPDLSGQMNCTMPTCQ